MDISVIVRLRADNIRPYGDIAVNNNLHYYLPQFFSTSHSGEIVV